MIGREAELDEAGLSLQLNYNRVEELVWSSPGFFYKIRDLVKRITTLKFNQINGPPLYKY